MASKEKKRKVLGSEVRAIIAKVNDFLKEEYEFMRQNNHDGCDLTPLAKVSKRTADALGISERTVHRILKEEKEFNCAEPNSTSNKFIAPMKRRRQRPSRPDIDKISPFMMRSVIYNYQAVHQNTPTLNKVRMILKDTWGFGGCPITLHRMLKKVGFTWCKTDINKKILVEKHDVKMWRFRYLKKMQQYRLENRPIVYTGVKFAYKTKKGTCYTIAIAGTKDGFLSNSLLIHKANANGENEFNMSREVYSRWITNNVLPNLPNNAVVVVAHEPYNDQLVNLPTAYSKEQEIVVWLKNHNITFDSNLHKLELYDIFRKNKDQFIVHSTDKMIYDAGFGVLRTPPKHPELNAIETILDTIETNVTFHDIGEDLNETKNIINTILKNVPDNMWVKSCAHVEELENTFKNYFDINVSFNINMHDEEDKDESSAEESEEEFKIEDIEEVDIEEDCVKMEIKEEVLE